MRITVVATSKIKEKYLAAGIAEFTKRLAPYCRLQINEITEGRMSDSPSQVEKAKALTLEGERLLKQVPPGSHIILLDVAGRQISSEELSAKLDNLALAGQSSITFIIGGPFGISPDLKKVAHEQISFSRMTFTHQMVRLLLVEQLYRGFKISRGEPYHL